MVTHEERCLDSGTLPAALQKIIESPLKPFPACGIGTLSSSITLAEYVLQTRATTTLKSRLGDCRAKTPKTAMMAIGAARLRV